MSAEYDSRQVVAKLYQLHEASNDTYHPALEVTSTHAHDEIWVAAVMYLVLDRYMSCVEESGQTEFLRGVLKVFHHLVRDQKGAEYINSVEPE